MHDYSNKFWVYIKDTCTADTLTRQYQNSRFEWEYDIMLGRATPNVGSNYFREIRLWQTLTHLSDANVKDYIWSKKGITYATATIATYPTDLKAYYHFTAASAYE